MGLFVLAQISHPALVRLPATGERATPLRHVAMAPFRTGSGPDLAWDLEARDPRLGAHTYDAK